MADGFPVLEGVVTILGTLGGIVTTVAALRASGARRHVERAQGASAMLSALAQLSQQNGTRLVTAGQDDELSAELSRIVCENAASDVKRNPTPVGFDFPRVLMPAYVAFFAIVSIAAFIRAATGGTWGDTAAGFIFAAASQSGSGSSSSAEYGSSSAAAAYLPSKVTSSSGSSTSMEYDDYGNQKSSQSGSVAGSKASINYNKDGTVQQATAPGNSGNPTKYTYDANKQLKTIDAPTQTADGVTKPIVGQKVYTYDDFGRVKTQTDGRNNTTTFGHDYDDRLLTTSFSDGTATVMNTYDGNGNQTGPSSAGGTISTTYDLRRRRQPHRGESHRRRQR
ncbi:hypothetical protein [Curtobacterium sp. NPDC089185]|uniref:hypothetical protein n=1 Tax=Curtobacterium sp. NPDC089185 TaxID=3154968 RepID=UPI003438F7E4